MTNILVTGATGTVGSRLVTALAGRPGVSVRAAVHSPAKAAAIAQAGHAQPVALDWSSRSSVAAAMEGIDKLFLLTPLTEDSVELGKRAIDAARATGVKHIVKLSSSGAEQEPGIAMGRAHRAVELHGEASGVAFTSLRPGSFMTNFITFFRPDQEGAIYLPLAQAASSYIDPRDIADVAAAVLTSDGHAGKSYTLTGPEALTVGRIAALIAEASGRKIHYVAVPEEAARGAMAGMGAPGWMVDGMMELYGIMRAGYTAGVTGEVAALTGHPARTFAAFARDHAAAWKA